jgi:ElaB/YqjD/DUF883 family membrane-anchored ribosome-binding protein
MHSTPESTSTFAASEDVARDGLSDIRRDIAGLKESIARMASQAGGDAAEKVRGMGQTFASQVGSAASGVADAGSDLAASAKEQVKTFASELETMARRNPLGTIAGALLVGVVIGLITRGRG